MSKKIVYVPAPNCVTEDNKHLVEPADPPYYVRCIKCNKHFYLVEEEVALEAGLYMRPRPAIKQ